MCTFFPSDQAISTPPIHGIPWRSDEICKVGVLTRAKLCALLHDFPEERGKFEELVHNLMEDSVNHHLAACLNATYIYIYTVYIISLSIINIYIVFPVFYSMPVMTHPDKKPFISEYFNIPAPLAGGFAILLGLEQPANPHHLPSFGSAISTSGCDCCEGR